MKITSLQLLLIALLVAILPIQTRAETVTLITGEKVEGKILRETEKELTLEIKISTSINDERVIEKSDIQKIEKVSPEDIAFQEIKNFKIDPKSSFKPEVYDRVVAALKSFQDSYPASAHAADVKQSLADFQAEKTRVDAGDVKFLGKWLSSKEAEKQKIQIAGQQAFDVMKFQSARQDWSGALNSFDLIERKYSGARIYPDAVDLAVQILTSLQRQVADRLKMIAYNQDQFRKALEMAKPEDLSKLRDGVKREQDQYAAAIAASKKNEAKWGPFIPRSSEAMTALQGAIPAELSRLKALPVQKMHASVGLVDDALAAISVKQSASAASLVDEAVKAWPKNDAALTMKEEIGAVKLAEKKATEAATAKLDSEEKNADHNPAPAPNSTAGKPFYMTSTGAMAIVGGVIALIGAITLLGRLQKPKEKSE
ncbi:MAG: PTPDL family protein [Verrucomicrobiota bacterium]